MKSKIQKFWLKGLVFFFFIASFQIDVFAQKYDPKSTDQKLATALQIINFAYVDTVNLSKLVESALINILKDLDPHSVYLSKEDLKEANEPLIGNFEGIGVQFNILKDTIIVISPTPGGPSEKVGVMAGDKIIKINDENAYGPSVNNNFVFKRLRGEKGTRVTISVYRRGRKELIDFTIVRDKIPINSLDAAFIIRPEIGYIKLNRFAQTTMQEFHDAISKLKKEGMKSLILDLNYNSGGYLNTAIDLADQFLEKDKLIVYTEGLNSPIQKSFATSIGDFEKGKLVVLINEGSASASEIVAGAIQDLDRGLIIGRRSFGKGLVQKPFNLPDGSAIRLTTARYHTPTGRCIQKSYSEGIDEYNNELNKRYKKGELLHPDSIQFPDSLKYFTPAKRVVYGGGGIMPDIFIPIDTSRVSDYFSALIRKGVLNQFTIQYVDNNRDSLKRQYPNIQKFLKEFIVDESLISQMVKYAEQEGVKENKEGLLLSEKFIKNNIKTLVARNIFDFATSFQVSVEIDESIQKAIEVLQDNTFKKLKIQY